MIFDCSEYITLSLLHGYFDCKFKRKSWLAQSSFGTIVSPMGPLARSVFSDAMQKERNISGESFDQ